MTPASPHWPGTQGQMQEFQSKSFKVRVSKLQCKNFKARVSKLQVVSKAIVSKVEQSRSCNSYKARGSKVEQVASKVAGSQSKSCKVSEATESEGRAMIYPISCWAKDLLQAMASVERTFPAQLSDRALVSLGRAWVELLLLLVWSSYLRCCFVESVPAWFV